MEEFPSVVPVEPVPAFTRKREDGEPDSSSMYFALFQCIPIILSSRLRAVALLRTRAKTEARISLSPSFPTLFIGNPSWFPLEWIPA
jgi:hypothetical protein